MHLATLLSVALGSVFLQQDVVASPGLTIERQSSTEDLSFCFDTNSICTVANQLWDQCSNFQEPYDDVKWFQCVCANGYVSVEEACFWCEEAYNLIGFDSSYSDKRSCSSVGVAVAPIPSSVLSLESQFNMTYTGIISGPGPDSTNPGASGSAAATTTTPDTAQQTSTPQLSLSNTPTTRSLAGTKTGQGVASVVSLNGGVPQPTPAASSGALGGSPLTVTVTSPSKSGASSTYGLGRAQGWTSSLGVMISILIYALAALYLI